jgi:predicted TIM-barrel fold metal-dependent hydrolase
MMVALPDHKTAALPPSADCHFHVIDHARFPFSGECGYTPRREESGTFEEASACMEAHGITHGLAVQPSGYGYDNSAMLEALARSDGRLKGIAVVPADVAGVELRRLSDAGVVGVRFNLTDFDPKGFSQKGVRRLIETVLDLDWFVEVQCRSSDFLDAAPLIAETGVRLLIDHLGGPDQGQGLNQPGFHAILGMADTGRATVKLSAAFRRSRTCYPFADLDPFVRALIEAYTPENCVWGSDWPFINWADTPDYSQTLSILARWVPEEQDRRTILWSTPAKLFGFEMEYDDSQS